MDIAVRLRLPAGNASLEFGLQSFNCSGRRILSPPVPLRQRLSTPRLQACAAEEADARVERESRRRPFRENVVTVPVTPKAQEADVWEDTEENRKRKWAAWKAAKAEKAAHQIQEKLSLSNRRKRYAEEQIEKLNRRMQLADAPQFKEQITDEERYMFQKLGLKMRAKLLLGRRGVFDGTVENMHLHWKYRELVKIIFKGSLFEAERTAKILEVESRGVLAGIVETSKGHAMIFFRGKNYERPSEIRPRHMLTKRQAYERSVEAQRKRDLERRVLKLEKEISKLQVGLFETADVNSNNGREGSSVRAALELGTDLEAFDDDAEFEANAEFNEDMADNIERKEDGPNPRRIVVLDPIFKAQPLTIKERLFLRQEALKQSDPIHINIGKSNMVTGLAKSIRLYFQKYPFAIVGVKGRAKGTPVEEIIQQVEEATGAVFVSREPNKLIIYRGWPAGERRPDMFPEDEKEEEVPPELRAAILREEIRNPTDFSYLTREECALVGIEYAGNGAEVEQEDDFNEDFDGRQHSVDEDGNYYGATEALWDDEKWYAEYEDGEDEHQDEDDAEAEIWNMKLEDIESD